MSIPKINSNYGSSIVLDQNLLNEHYDYKYSQRPPPTPAPKSINNIQDEIRQRFVGFLYLTKEPDMNIEDYFIEYDHWEEYDEKKSYSKRPFFYVYKNTMKKYQNYICFMEEGEDMKYYVLAKKMKSELEDLERYCPCIRCKSSIFNPLKYLFCPYCTKCISAGEGFANPHYVKVAQDKKRHYEHNKHKPLTNYKKMIQFLEPIMVIEVSSVAIFFGYLIYNYFM